MLAHFAAFNKSIKFNYEIKERREEGASSTSFTNSQTHSSFVHCFITLMAIRLAAAASRSRPHRSFNSFHCAALFLCGLPASIQEFAFIQEFASFTIDSLHSQASSSASFIQPITSLFVCFFGRSHWRC